MTIAPKKILLIHNNPQERGKLAIMLSRFGHEVRFSSGKGCTNQMLMSNDLVIIDDQLGNNSGLNFINQISSRLCEKVIYLASHPFLAASRELQNLNFYEWVTKPVDPLKLAVVVCDYFVEIANKQHPVPK
jgi:DNA-binding NtrC family response regulator